MPLEDALSFLDRCFENWPDKQRYIIDLSGSGEPLLALPTILKIKEYCLKKQDQLNREVLVQFVCNGTLLDLETILLLQKKGILFGISLDGNQTIHDRNRMSSSGVGSFDGILKALKQAPSLDYVGVACTLTKNVFSLKASLKNLCSVFPTVAYKPARRGPFALDQASLGPWLEEYGSFCRWLLSETVAGRLIYVKALLNGDDFFGKFLRRCLLGQRVACRCDAGLTRVCLGIDGRIYPCPPASALPETAFSEKADSFSLDEAYQKAKAFPCERCWCRHVCGGRCLVEDSLGGYGSDGVECRFTQGLVGLAMWFSCALGEQAPKTKESISQFAKGVAARNFFDPRIGELQAKHPEMTFTEAKDLLDKRLAAEK